jgi:glycosyltransferase involved in cell wall biosynthesis
MGSVSQIGWEWFIRLSKELPVTLITHIRNRKQLADAGADTENGSIHFIDTEWFAGPLYRFSKRLFPNSEHSVFLISSLDFFLFDYLALRNVRGWQRRGSQWDLIHIPTPVSPSAASLLHRSGIPVIRGPLNGGLSKPSGFTEIMNEESSWIYSIRRLGLLWDSIVGSSRNSDRILVATQATWESIPKAARDRCISVLENGIDEDLFAPSPWPTPPSEKNPLRILFVGRLIPFKGIPFLMEAISGLPSNFPCELRIVGDGPMRAAWEKEARKFGVSDRTSFLGNLSLFEVGHQMAWSHVFVLPSVRESGGAVLLESMACGRPVVAFDFGGPSEIVDTQVGTTIPASVGSENLANELAAILRDIHKNPGSWQTRGSEGIMRVRQRFSWNVKIRQILSIYKEVINDRISSGNRRSHDSVSCLDPEAVLVPHQSQFEEIAQ